jgi:1-deoxy-D-xylulose-5-phosphate reductoisomerase
MRNLVILGATGTVGRNTLDVARRHADKLRVLALSANADARGLAELCHEFRPRRAVLADARAAGEFRALAPHIELQCGTEALEQIAADEDADLVMSAIVGAAGLRPTLAALRARRGIGRRVLIANKEPLVMAGALLMAEARRGGAEIVPIDSEHNAIYQCLPAGFRCGETARGVRRLILTASGGPFRELPLAELARVTPAQAVRHPNWVMGRKISVDSATMMNKGLELIEAATLYGLGDDRLDVVLHPESVIHSLVEYVDGSTLAQLGQPDMRIPIAHALAAPERWESGVGGVDLPALARLRFESPEAAPHGGRYPCLALARQALRAGGIAPNVLNAANEVAVEAFLGGRIPFTAIAPMIETTLAAAAGAALPPDDGLEAVTLVDAWARRRATETLRGPAREALHA